VTIAVIGTGTMSRGFATALSSRHEVVFGSRDSDRAGKAVRATGAAGVTTSDQGLTDTHSVVCFGRLAEAR
jgi:predicted dinucleotide-binding enzyme